MAYCRKPLSYTGLRCIRLYATSIESLKTSLLIETVRLLKTAPAHMWQLFEESRIILIPSMTKVHFLQKIFFVLQILYNKM